MTADATRLRRALTTWSGAVQRQAIPDTAARMRRNGNVPREDGELARSIQAAGVVSGGATFRGRIEARVIQAATTDKGARAHIIVPRRRGGVLVFSPKTGGVVFTRRVNHPGNPPRPWWRRTLEEEYRPALVRAARSVPFR